MSSEKATYWIAVGVLALVASNNLAARHTDAVRSLARRSVDAIEQVSGHVSSLAAMAETMLGRGEPGFEHGRMALADVQTRVASAQSVLACHQAVFARMQAEHARLIAMQQLRGSVICPRQNLRIVVPAAPSMRADGTL